MKSLRASSAKSQQGSVYTTMILVALFALVILATLKVAPAFIDDNAIAGTMENLTKTEDYPTMSINEVRQSLMRTFNTNRIDFNDQDIVLVKEGAKEYIDINYESRKTLFYNIDAVVKFEHRFEKN